MAGSRAVSACEPGQIRKEAALSESVHAPRISLAGAEDRRARPGTRLDGGCTVHYLTRKRLRLTRDRLPARSVARILTR